MRRVIISVIFVLMMAAAIPLSPAAKAAGNAGAVELTKSGGFDSIVIWCGSEDIVIKQGGTELKIELEAGTKGSYQIRDNTGIPMADRYFYYNKWDVIFERTDRHSQTDAYSSTITVTIPDEGIESVLLRTGSGSIQVSGLRGPWLNIESESGGISVSNSSVECVEAHTDGPVTLTNITATGKVTVRSDGLIALSNVTADSQVTINRKTYTATDGVYSITAEGWK